MNAKTLLSLLLFLPSTLLAAPKIATLNSTKVLKSFQASKNDAAEYEAAKKELSNNPRKLALEDITKKITELQEKMKDASEGSDERAQIIQEGEVATVAFEDLRKKWTQYNTEKMRSITEKYMDANTKRNEKIAQTAKKLGESLGYDWVLESAAVTNSKMPMVLYIRKSTDITDLVIEELEKNAPASTEKPAPKPE